MKTFQEFIGKRGCCLQRSGLFGIDDFLAVVLIVTVVTIVAGTGVAVYKISKGQKLGLDIQIKIKKGELKLKVDPELGAAFITEELLPGESAVGLASGGYTDNEYLVLQKGQTPPSGYEEVTEGITVDPTMDPCEAIITIRQYLIYRVIDECNSYVGTGGFDANHKVNYADGNALLNASASWGLDANGFKLVSNDSNYVYTDGSQITGSGEVNVGTFALSANKSLTTRVEGSSQFLTFSVSPTPFAHKPNPVDGGHDISLPQILTWKPGAGVAYGSPNGHYVYFGTDFDEVSNADTTSLAYMGRQDPCTYNPGTLAADTSYYWRVDEYNDTNTHSPWRGKVWWFKTIGVQAGNPVPTSGTVGLPITLQLSWTSGAFAAHHDVYFGPNETNVTNASTDNQKGCYMGRQDSNIFRLDAAGFKLAADTNYYWRIDEVNDACSVVPWKGNTWMFRNTNYFVVDDFESYADTASMTQRWKTGYVIHTSPTFYAHAGLALTKWFEFERLALNSCILFDYSNTGTTPYSSEGRFDCNALDVNGGQDWTGGGALPDTAKCKALQISYLGDIGNGRDGNTNMPYDVNYDRMFMMITDTAGKIGFKWNPDLYAQKQTTWQHWDINLAEINTPNAVNLTKVKWLNIGFGNRLDSSLAKGGSGIVLFDDIRLYQSMCSPAHLPVGDFTGDCTVNYADVNFFADNWLARGAYTAPSAPTVAPVIQYDFNDGNYYGDTTTHIKNHGTGGSNFDAEVNWVNIPYYSSDPETALYYLWDNTNKDNYDGNLVGKDAGCINLTYDENATIDVCNPDLALNFLRTTKKMTIATWVKMDYFAPIDRWARLVSIWQLKDDVNTPPDACSAGEVVEIEAPTPQEDTPRINFALPDSNNVSSGTVDWNDYGGVWNHLAFVRVASGGSDVNRIAIYRNGAKVAEVNNTTGTMFGHNLANTFTSFRIGSFDNTPANCWIGKIDDFRVYDYALTDAQISWLGTVGHTGYAPMTNKANLKTGTLPEVVNFGDYALLAQNWLVTQYFP